MEDNQKKSTGRLEINDLIDDAVSNAMARRSLNRDSDDVMSGLSYEETASIAGGLTTDKVVTLKAVCPPVAIGLIALDPSNQQTL
jgi:hypothetical protein